MEWTDEAIILSVRPYGEHSAIVRMMTQEHGFHASFSRAGQSRKYVGILQPGNLVEARWYARSSTQLGSLSVILLQPYAETYFTDRNRLMALTSACSMIAMTCAPGDPQPTVFHNLRTFFDRLNHPCWALFYVLWELDLLNNLGFGLNLSRCAITGNTDDLAYVSMRTGCALSRSARRLCKDPLLPLPNFLITRNLEETYDLSAGARVTGFFLHRFLLQHLNEDLIYQRQYLCRWFRCLKEIQSPTVRPSPDTL